MALTVLTLALTPGPTIAGLETSRADLWERNRWRLAQKLPIFPCNAAAIREFLDNIQKAVSTLSLQQLSMIEPNQRHWRTLATWRTQVIKWLVQNTGHALNGCMTCARIRWGNCIAKELEDIGEGRLWCPLHGNRAPGLTKACKGCARAWASSLSLHTNYVDSFQCPTHSGDETVPGPSHGVPNQVPFGDMPNQLPEENELSYNIFYALCMTEKERRALDRAHTIINLSLIHI